MNRMHFIRSWDNADRLLLYAMIAALPLQALALLPGTTHTIPKLAGAALIASVFMRCIIERKSPAFPRHMAIAVVLFGLACALSIPNSIDRALSLSNFQTLGMYALTLVAVAHVASSRETHYYVPSLYVVGASISGGLGLLGYLSVITPTVDEIVPSMNVRRVCVGSHDCNDQALLLLFGLAFLLFDRRHWTRSWTTALWMIAGAGIAMGLLLTMSRTGWMMAFVLILGFLFTAHIRLRYIVAGLVLAGILVSAFAVTNRSVVETAQRRLTAGFLIGDESAGSRIVHLSEAIDFARAAGPTGEGLGTAMRPSDRFTSPLGERISSALHNVPLILWLETGWIGIFAYGWLWSAIIALIWTAIRRSKANGHTRDAAIAYAALIAVYFVFSLVMPFIYRSAFPILLGCALGAIAPALSSARDPDKRK